MDTPYAMVFRAEVATTQDLAKDQLSSGDRPVLVVAQSQTEGRGRTGHDWQTAPRALATSLALPTSWQTSEQTLIPLIAGLAARSALRDEVGALPRLKWPNDLVTTTGKVGGLLVEAADGIVVVGCGVNLWWPQPPHGYAGLLDRDPGPEASEGIARNWADRLLPLLERATSAWDRAGYIEACSTIGQVVTWEPDGRGTAIDVDRAGGLVVDRASGRVTLRSGSVHHVRDATLAAGSPDEGSDT